MSAHTPGPWRLAPDDDLNIETDDYLIAYCYLKPVRGQAAANACLIAAAPELLDALKEASRAFGGVNHEEGSPIDLALRSINRAIAKAEGRS